MATTSILPFILSIPNKVPVPSKLQCIKFPSSFIPPSGNWYRHPSFAFEMSSTSGTTQTNPLSDLHHAAQ